MLRRCRRCRWIVRDGAAFCAACGIRLRDPADVAAVILCIVSLLLATMSLLG